MTEDFFGKYNWDGKTILIAEDDISSIFYLKEILKDTGANLLIAKDGEKSIQLCRKHSNIDIVLMDIQMPLINGYEATRQIKALRNDLPVIAQTAYAMPEEKKRCFDSGCDDYIAKPISPFDLLAKMSRFL